MIALNCNKALIELVKEAVEDFRLSAPPRQTERIPGSLFEENTPEFAEDPEALHEIAVHDVKMLTMIPQMQLNAF